MTEPFPTHLARRARLLSLRLPPGADLRGALERLAAERAIEAAWVISATGSLHDLVIRPAAVEGAVTLPGPWELLSLYGSLGPDGAHLHVCAADGRGACRGGHLLPGNRIRTTAEIALSMPDAVRFQRRHDPRSGHRELGFAACDGP